MVNSTTTSRNSKLLRVLAVAAALVIGATVWMITHWDPRELRNQLAEKVASLDRGRSLRGPPLIGVGASAAPFVCVVAWDPLDAKSVAVVKAVIAKVDSQSDSRAVILPVPAFGGFDAATMAYLLDRDGELLPLLRNAVQVVDSQALRAQWETNLGATKWLQLEVVAQDRDAVQSGLTSRRVAEGLSLQAGDLLLNGVRVPVASAADRPKFDQAWQDQLTRYEGLLRYMKGNSTAAQEKAARTGSLQPYEIERYLHWIVRNERLKQI